MWVWLQSKKEEFFKKPPAVNPAATLMPAKTKKKVRFADEIEIEGATTKAYDDQKSGASCAACQPEKELLAKKVLKLEAKIAKLKEDHQAEVALLEEALEQSGTKNSLLKDRFVELEDDMEAMKERHYSLCHSSEGINLNQRENQLKERLTRANTELLRKTNALRKANDTIVEHAMECSTLKKELEAVRRHNKVLANCK